MKAEELAQALEDGAQADIWHDETKTAMLLAAGMLRRQAWYIEQIARMTADGEVAEDDVVVAIDSDDAIETINRLIMEARKLSTTVDQFAADKQVA